MKSSIAPFLMVLASLAVLSGCGVKGDPLPVPSDSEESEEE